MSASEWERARRPNYVTNVDLRYPYSELPYVGEYDLVKIPIPEQLIDHVDYWGEGRIETLAGISGFPNCYNVNRQYQLVSNGPDIDRKIPNRIPVIDENHCDTSSYIEEDSVKIVTLMGAPIIKKCAEDIERIVNSKDGKVVVYGFSDSSPDIKSLEDELQKKAIFFCFGYPLPESLKGLTLFDTHHAYLNSTDINEELYYNVTGGDYIKAVEVCKTLAHNGGGFVLTDVVNKLLDQGIPNTMNLVYHLWLKGEKDIVTNYFPNEFNLILSEANLKIISKKYDLALKLDAHTDEYNDRLAWGDNSDKTSDRLKWRIEPSLEKSNVFFKIANLEYNMFLKLDSTPDEIGDRKAWGSDGSNELRHTWKLEPIKVNDEVLFYIVNREYEQALKLDAHTDDQGDRLVWGHKGNVAGNPGYFGWRIQAW